MSLAGLRYQASHYGQAPQETKSGSYVYSGSPSGFHEWQFRTQIRVAFLKQKIRKKMLDYQANKSASTSPERTRQDRTPVGRRGKSGRPRGEPSASGDGPTRPRLPGDPEDEEEDEEEEEEVDPDIDEFASPRALSFTGLMKEEQMAGEVDTLRAELVQKVLEGLRGDAYLAAQDLGVERLMREDGIDELIQVIKRMTFPLQSLEAKELFRAGQQNSGPQNWTPPCRSLRV